VEHSNLDANIIVELAINKVVELQKQVLLTEAKFISVSQEYNKLKTEYEILKNKSDEWVESSQSTPTRKTTTK